MKWLICLLALVAISFAICNEKTTILRSKAVVLDSKTEPKPATLIIRKGKIEKITEYDDYNSFSSFITVDAEQAACSSYNLIDVGNKAIIAGGIDPHVHINEPGQDNEGFVTATQAAAVAGLTTLIDMPLNSIPVTTSVTTLEEKIAVAKDKIFVNVGFFGGVVPGNANEVKKMHDAGVLGFKSFMIFSGLPEFEAVSYADMVQGLAAMRGLNTSYLIHAEIETEEYLQLQEAAKQKDGSLYKTYLESRPSSMEVEAIKQVITACRNVTGVTCHIVHLATAEALELIKNAQAEFHLTAETCTHYLSFAAEEIQQGATEFKCAPPIREATHRESLWQGLRDGVLSMVTSDHSPCTHKPKSFVEACGGICSLQFSLSALWTHMSTRGFTLQDLVKWRSEEPAKLTGLEKRKGKIQVGMDADLIVFDTNACLVASSEGPQYYHKNKRSPFLNRPLKGKVDLTMVNGEIVYFNGTMGSAPRGRIVLRG